MEKKIFCGIVLAIFAVTTVSGCGTAQKKRQEEISGIKAKVETIESRLETVETRQAEAERAIAERGQQPEEMAGEKMAKSNVGIKSRGGKSRERTKDIQTCLKNAGYYKGPIDGLKGRSTKRAIKEFQKANGLTADGVVGKKTWELLSKHAEGQTSPQEVVK